MIKKVLLNCLPPADVLYPSSQLSILKSFLEKHKIHSGIKYWNFIIDPVSEYKKNGSNVDKLLPFYSILNEKYQTDGVAENISHHLSTITDFDTAAALLKIESMKMDIRAVVRKELENIHFNDILLFGFTAKFLQWIPAIFMAEEVKRISPETRIVIGGFGSAEAATQAMRLCSFFDFAIWGEGEYPLLELCQQLQQDECFIKVPRLIYRNNGEITFSEKNKSGYLDFNEPLIPDFDDFINIVKKLKKSSPWLNINSARSCYWNNCKFCDFNSGYKYRVKKIETVIEEIDYYRNKYNAYAFLFVDNDVFVSIDRFKQLIDAMVVLNQKHNQSLTYWFEMIPSDRLDNSLFKKMKQAGVDYIYIGYEGTCETLLKKMNKKNGFVENLLFLKLSLKNNITPYMALITDIPDETKEEVIQTKDNFHFLRFYYNHNIKLQHLYAQLRVTTMTPYYKLFSQEEKDQYTYNEMTDFLPSEFYSGNERFSLFRWRKNKMTHKKEWDDVYEAEKTYQKAKYNYQLNADHDGLVYKEYKGSELVIEINLNDPVLISILKHTNDRIVGFSELQKILDVEKDRLRSSVEYLKKNYLVYADKEMTKVVSVIDIDGFYLGDTSL